MRRIPLSIWLLAAMVLSAILAGQLLQSSRPLGRVLEAADPRLGAATARDHAPRAEPANADVTMVVFSDYQCGVCREDHPALARAVAADGRVRVIDRDWPIFGPLSFEAARVAIAAGRQGRHAAVHDRLMRRPGRLDRAAMSRAVAEAGGDWRRIQADLRAHGPAIDAQIRRNASLAGSLALPGTPAYLIGRTLVIGRLGEAGFRRAFAEARDQ